MRISDWSSDVCSSDLHALALARNAIGRLNHHKPVQLQRRPFAEPLYDPQELNGIIPNDTRKPYDVREVIARVVDGSEFDEFKARFGTTQIGRASCRERVCQYV